MRRDIYKVRKSIAKRKREKSLTSNMSVPKKSFVNHVFPQDEEKHGYMPISESVSSSKSMKDTFVASFLMKSILAAVLFFGVAIFMRMEGEWLNTPKQWTSNALTEEFPFATVNAWYQKKFGSTLALTPNNGQNSENPATLPVNGTVSQSFEMNGEGIMIKAEGATKVTAVEQGTVIFAGNDSKTNKTVVIQHPDRSKTIYGNLSSIHVHHYQFVASNAIIGEFEPSEANASNVYFAIEKDNQYLDPVKVMQVDERP
ncbi:M23 family metallopeptidase [Aquibacillus albus]|uniref:Stage IV sporulation protein FA n=1 Tax=Aquibacillus albus TaxID=1168171 RepID=A0ABS2N1T8_9BACI|nr:M23 family metallopeptidase [Aquibacillus albus]MBM7572033.1 stage IV sporulation protein FA [Aquibacillus albus]